MTETTGTLLDGKAVAQTVRQTVKVGVAQFLDRHGYVPGLATVLVGDDPASRVYVSTKEKACQEVGIRSCPHRLPASTAAKEVLQLINELNQCRDVHGILVQLPLPAHLDQRALILALAPEKDVDGLHPFNQGRLVLGEDALRPCTPLGVMRLIEHTGMSLTGKKAIVIGRSMLVGKPVALMLLEQNATVTCCHSKTVDLAGEVRAADVVVAAIGQPEAIKGDWIKPGAVVIDVGISRMTDNKLRGDVEFTVAKERASFITPVPGGVGPMTVAMLLANTLKATERISSQHSQ
ncbi:MAG: bifunctional methylenetetrahydrofolate dehydrogenase/methenyltetrahydrofolate cyclohydrolase FolD [Deltaproteobacteria bacterium]|nr:bifunctional methylenetetrahydrofolate dehydrogenase/methenyltetrahydrofolate cyclohydrolase FolD [Deltaproteobacteria bacterium]